METKEDSINMSTKAPLLKKQTIKKLLNFYTNN